MPSRRVRRVFEVPAGKEGVTVSAVDVLWRVEMAAAELNLCLVRWWHAAAMRETKEVDRAAA